MDDVDDAGERDAADSGRGGLAGVVAALAVARELLDGLEGESLDGAELGAALVGVRGELERLEGGLGKLARRFKVSQAWRVDGDRTVVCWLARQTRRSKKDEERLIGLGEKLISRPELDVALGAGEIHCGHVEQLGALADDDRYGEAYELTVDELLDAARSMYWAEFMRFLKQWKLLADEDGAERDAESDEKARYLRIAPGLRGTGLVDGELTATGRETVTNSLDLIEAELFQQDWEEARERLGRNPQPHELARSKHQRLHDALVEMAVRAHTAPKDGKRPEPLLSIHLGIEMLERACELESGEPLTAGQVSPLLDRALVEWIVWDGPARIMEIGEKRTFTGALRRAIQARDRTCRFPGCDIPGKWCDVDHNQPYSRDGKTVQTNGYNGCGPHNQAKGDTPPEQLGWEWELRRWNIPRMPRRDGPGRTCPRCGGTGRADANRDSSRDRDTGTDPPLTDTA